MTKATYKTERFLRTYAFRGSEFAMAEQRGLVTGLEQQQEFAAGRKQTALWEALVFCSPTPGTGLGL